VHKRPYDRLRAMYVGGRGNATARRYAWFWNMAFRLGILPRRWVTLEVCGRRTGTVTRFPLGMADVGGQWYVVSMLGECNWVRNVRAAEGRATLRRRRRAGAVRLFEVPVDKRAPVIRRYVGRVPGGRPHIPVDRHEPVEAFETIASNYPVFRVVPL
jgi:deazaflavin-dependent oxidoreductase (nitroreductase family)